MEKGVRHTRWQAAPDWSPEECLTLVSEINAVEGEWRNSLASFQKWQLVVENCGALGINRNLNQCKRKWDALRNEYEKIKAWEESYWSFDTKKRKDLGLPEEFDEELLGEISRYFKQKGDDVAAPDTEPDTDPEPQARTKRMFLQTGPKKQRRKRLPRKNNTAQRLHPWGHILSVIGKAEPPSSLNGSGPDDRPRGRAEPSTTNGVPEHHQPRSKLEKVEPPDSGRNLEKIMTAKLLENVQLMNAILGGNHVHEDVDYKLADLMKNSEAMEIDSVRRQGDKIIDCLGNIVNTLNQFCSVIQEGNVRP